MAETKHFIDLDNLALYDGLLKNVMSEEDAKALKTVSISGTVLKFYREENPTSSTQPAYSIDIPQQDLSNYVEKIVNGPNGKALVFNEAVGGGAKFEHNDGTMSFTGVNDGGENGITGQIYTVKKIGNKYVGTRINMTLDGFYYTSNADSSAFTADDEIATKGDITAISSADKTVYITETAGGSGDVYSKRYGIYQGDNGSAQSPVPAEKLADIDIPKDMFLESGTVETVTTPDVPYAGAKVGDKYIDLILANSSSDHIYIPANSLVDVYTAAQGATEVQLAIDNNNVISASIVAVNGSKLVDGTVTKAKLVQAVQNSLDLADSALQETDIDSVADEDIENLFS